jgi:hypothetical protein
VEEYNLSLVSENLNGVLNESDLHLIEETTPNQSVDSRSEIQEIRDRLAEKKARQSIVDKFFKKEPAGKSQPSDKPAFQIAEQPAFQPPPTPAPQVDPITNSLNFTESL